MNIKVSIIVPCYNQGAFLPETLDSILSQTYQQWECVICDDGSSDNTAFIVDKYKHIDSRFKYIYQPNQGPASARNNAILHSSGAYILPLDADDIIAETFIEKAEGYLEKHPETTLVYSKGAFLGEETGAWELPAYRYDSFIWSNCICSCAMFRRIDYNRTDGYNTNMVYGDEDWDFWLTLLDKESKVHRIDEILFFYRIHGQSRTTKTFASNIGKAKRQIYHNHPQIYQSFVDNIVLLKDQNLILQHRVSDIQKKYDSIYNSKAYRIGRVILTPFRLLRKLLIIRQ